MRYTYSYKRRPIKGRQEGDLDFDIDDVKADDLLMQQRVYATALTVDQLGPMEEAADAEQ